MYLKFPHDNTIILRTACSCKLVNKTKKSLIFMEVKQLKKSKLTNDDIYA